MLEMVYDPTAAIALKFINLQHNFIISYMRFVIEFMGVDGLEHLIAERNSRIGLDTRACGLAEVHL